MGRASKERGKQMRLLKEIQEQREANAAAAKERAVKEEDQKSSCNTGSNGETDGDGGEEDQKRREKEEKIFLQYPDLLDLHPNPEGFQGLLQEAITKADPFSTQHCFGGLPWDVTENLILYYLDFPSLMSCCKVYTKIHKFVHDPVESVTRGTSCFKLLQFMFYKTVENEDRMKHARKRGSAITKNRYGFLDKMKWYHGCLPKQHPCWVERNKLSQVAQDTLDWGRKMLLRASSNGEGHVHVVTGREWRWGGGGMQDVLAERVVKIQDEDWAQRACPHETRFIAIKDLHATCTQCGLRTVTAHNYQLRY